MDLHTIDFKNKCAVIRVDFNVPIDKSTHLVSDATRILAALPTIEYILNAGGKCVLMSHLGRPKGEKNEKYSLQPIADFLKELKKFPITFVQDCVGEEVSKAAADLAFGEVLLLENLRFYKEEEAGDIDFAKGLAALGDVYVMDAFGTAHRAHASTAVMANFFENEKKCFGKLMAAEVTNGEKVLKSAAHPLVAIVGGAKVSDKILILKNLLDIADAIIIGGAMAYTFLKSQGKPIGKSLCEEDKLSVALDLLEKAAQKGVKIYLPVDSVAVNQFEDQVPCCTVDHSTDGDWMCLDIGNQSIEIFRKVITTASTILWNGPMGVFERPAFAIGTEAIALSVVQATQSGAFSLVGGGDSVAAIQQLGLGDQVSYLSTGGGASAEMFEGKVLPGIAAIRGF